MAAKKSLSSSRSRYLHVLTDCSNRCLRRLYDLHPLLPQAARKERRLNDKKARGKQTDRETRVELSIEEASKKDRKRRREEPSDLRQTTSKKKKSQQPQVGEEKKRKKSKKDTDLEA